MDNIQTDSSFLGAFVDVLYPIFRFFSDQDKNAVSLVSKAWNQAIVKVVHKHETHRLNLYLNTVVKLLERNDHKEIFLKHKGLKECQSLCQIKIAIMKKMLYISQDFCRLSKTENDKLKKIYSRAFFNQFNQMHASNYREDSIETLQMQLDNIPEIKNLETLRLIKTPFFSLVQKKILFHKIFDTILESIDDTSIRRIQEIFQSIGKLEFFSDYILHKINSLINNKQNNQALYLFPLLIDPTNFKGSFFVHLLENENSIQNALRIINEISSQDIRDKCYSALANLSIKQKDIEGLEILLSLILVRIRDENILQECLNSVTNILLHDSKVNNLTTIISEIKKHPQITKRIKNYFYHNLIERLIERNFVKEAFLVSKEITNTKHYIEAHCLMLMNIMPIKDFVEFKIEISEIHEKLQFPLFEEFFFRINSTIHVKKAITLIPLISHYPTKVKISQHLYAHFYDLNKFDLSRSLSEFFDDQTIFNEQLKNTFDGTGIQEEIPDFDIDLLLDDDLENIKLPYSFAPWSDEVKLNSISHLLEAGDRKKALLTIMFLKNPLAYISFLEEIATTISFTVNFKKESYLLGNISEISDPHVQLIFLETFASRLVENKYFELALEAIIRIPFEIKRNEKLKSILKDLEISDAEAGLLINRLNSIDNTKARIDFSQKWCTVFNIN